MKNKVLAILFALLLVFTAAFSVGADFGDYGGDSDYGDYGGNDNNYDSHDDYDYDNDDDDYRYNGAVGGSTSSSSDSGSGGWLGAVIIVAIIVAVILFRNKGKGKRRGSVAPGATATDPSTLKSVDEYKSLDPNFSEAEFTEKISNLYVQFQNSWTAKNIEDLRPYLSDTFYAQCDRQLDSYRKNHTTNRVDRPTVLGVQLMGFKQQNGSDLMVARLRTRIVDYVVDDATGNVVRGSNTAEKFMEYEWIMARTSGRTTGDGSEGTTVQNCPNCGAPVNINSTARCEFCGSVLTTDSFDWLVTEIKGIAQKTAG